MRKTRRTYNRLSRFATLEDLEQRQLLAADAFVPHSEPDGEVVAEFSLLDVNPSSDTYNQLISPSDYRGQVSAWYFGFAT